MIPYSPTSMHKHIRSHSVFIYNVDKPGNGSGVLIELAKRTFVLSAQHIIEDDIDINLGIVPHQSRFTILDKWADSELDIGFIELSPTEVYLRLSEVSAPFRVGARKANKIPSKKTTFALCGFPYTEGRERDRGREYPVTYVTVAILAPEQWPSDHAANHDPTTTFLIPYGPRRGGSFIDGDKNPRDPVMPHGMSGCGLWYFDPETETSEKPVYSLAGIQHHYDPVYQVLIGTLIDPLINKIAKHCNIELTTMSVDGAP